MSLGTKTWLAGASRDDADGEAALGPVAVGIGGLVQDVVLPGCEGVAR